jgi:hypothetical protein
MTTAEMVTLTRDQIGEDSTTATQITDAQILKFLNKKMAELCADAELLPSTFTTSTVAGQQLYNVPPEYISIQAIQIYRTTGDSQKEWLTRVDIDDLDPALATGTPFQWANWGANLSGDNSPVFCLDPIPLASGTSDLIVHCYQYPKTMVSGGQAPEVRLRWQYACVDGATADAFLRLASGDGTLLAMCDRWTLKWNEAKKAAVEWAMLDLYSPRPAKNTMGYGRRR